MDSHRERNKVLPSFKQIKRLPINLRKKAIREARNLAGMQQRNRPAKPKVIPVHKQNDFDRAEHNAMLAATSQELQKILRDCDLLSDVPYDTTPTELLGQIAIAEKRSTTIYVQRNGLSTLKVVLHQRSPTIAQLKKAIASISLAQQKRSECERRRVMNEDADGLAEDGNRQQVVGSSTTTAGTKAMARSTGELVYSALRNGHEHRALVSWRFLWRCFALFNVDTNQPIDDNVVNGRATLTALGIKNGTVLKFVHRVKYFGRRRQS